MSFACEPIFERMECFSHSNQELIFHVTARKLFFQCQHRHVDCNANRETTNDAANDATNKGAEPRDDGKRLGTAP